MSTSGTAAGAKLGRTKGNNTGKLRYGVKTLLGVLAHEAKEKGCDVALYGHTHRADICEMDGVTLINPGSLRYP